MSVIFVIAADSALRRSLQFALEAENLTVDAHDGLESAKRSRLLDLATCAVVDEDVLDDRGAAMRALQRFAKPVILLVARPPACAGHDDIAILVKPLQWDALVGTVRAMQENVMPRGLAGRAPDRSDDGGDSLLPTTTT
jgi:DNA-binding response OmpR family regulator